jgi:hypothetical protein
MPDKIPERSKAFIELECLKVARGAVGCSDLRAVRIGRLKPRGGGPNWEVLGFSPELDKLAHDEALEKIAPLRQMFALVSN